MNLSQILVELIAGCALGALVLHALFAPVPWYKHAYAILRLPLAIFRVRRLSKTSVPLGTYCQLHYPKQSWEKLSLEEQKNVRGFIAQLELALLRMVPVRALSSRLNLGQLGPASKVEYLSGSTHIYLPGVILTTGQKRAIAEPMEIVADLYSAAVVVSLFRFMPIETADYILAAAIRQASQLAETSSIMAWPIVQGPEGIN